MPNTVTNNRSIPFDQLSREQRVAQAQKAMGKCGTTTAKKIAKWKERGFRIYDAERVCHNNKISFKVTFIKEVQGPERAACVAKTAALVASGVGILGFASQNVRDTAALAKNGEISEEIMIPTGEADPSYNQKNGNYPLGYNPCDSQSIKAYLLRPENKERICEWAGHYYLEITHRKGISSFLFVPNKDFDKAVSVKSTIAKTGKAITDSAMMSRHIRIFCWTYDAVEKGRKVAIGKLVDRLKESYPFIDQHKYKDEKEYEDYLRKRATEVIDRAEVVINVKNSTVRFIPAREDWYEFDAASRENGWEIKVDKGTWENIGKLFDQQKDEKSKARLPEQPFKGKGEIDENQNTSPATNNADEAGLHTDSLPADTTNTGDDSDDEDGIPMAPLTPSANG